MDQKKFEIGTVVRMIGQETLMTIESNFNNRGANVIWFDDHGVLHRDCISRDLLTTNMCSGGLCDEREVSTEICIDANIVNAAYDGNILKVHRAFVNRKSDGELIVSLYTQEAYEERCKQFVKEE